MSLTFLAILLLGPPFELAAQRVARLLAAAALGGAHGPRRPEALPGQLAVVRVAGVRLLGYACCKIPAF